MDTSKFAELGLNEHVLEGVAALGFTEPTPVQAQAIPVVLQGRDVVASAQTGTGKTAAFALPVLQVIAAASQAARIKQQEQFAADAEKAAQEAAAREQLAASAEPEPVAAPTEPAAEHEESAPLAQEPNKAAAAPAPEATPVAEPSAKPKRRRRRHHKAKTALDPQPLDTQEKPQEPGDDQAEDSPSGPDVLADAAHPEPSISFSPEEGSPHKPKRRRRNKKRKPKNAAARQDAPQAPAHPFGPFALVITPTRELAQQIDNVVSVVCKHTDQRAVIVMGGTKFDRQIKELQAGCDMLVATPGRLIDLMEHDHVDLSQVQVLVLDEADRMLDMGFWPSVRRIVAACPKDRQTLLFSATIPPSIKGTVDAMLRDPVNIQIARIGETADTVEEHLCPVTQGQKTPLLEALVRTYGPERVLVFCRTKHRVDDVSKFLGSAGVEVVVMHADRSQKDRERALAKFRAGKCQILVATDVMSRGIDVSGIDAVVNFDVPMDPEDYVHRIGRTGRAGHTGQAFTFVAPDEISQLREVEYFTGKLVPTWDLEGFVYDSARIVPNADRSTKRPTRTMFSGMRSRGRGISAGRYGRHY